MKIKQWGNPDPSLERKLIFLPGLYSKYRIWWGQKKRNRKNRILAFVETNIFYKRSVFRDFINFTDLVKLTK